MNKYDEILELKEYEIQNKIFAKGKWKFYTLLNITNGIKYLAKISKKLLKSLPREELMDLSQELSISSKLNHPYILKFIDIVRLI